MSFVLDASISACWAFDDESHPHADAAFARMRRDHYVEAPAIWWFELPNTLLVGERRGRISQESTTHFLRDLSLVDFRADRHPDSDEMLRLARLYDLTVYDAAYLELALRKRLDLASLDTRLIKAARKEAVRVIGVDV